MKMDIYDPTPCHLGEGPLWHPERQEFFWFDILRFRLHARVAGHTNTWQFDEHVSAAGWVDPSQLLIASETRLFLFDLASGSEDTIVPLEAETSATRSNDGRADPYGGFWIGTMGKAAESGAGAIYRYFRGEVRKIFPGISISNAICFSPDGLFAYFTDTPTKIVQRVRLSEADGWPIGDPEPWLDLHDGGWNPDGAVVDADGNFWNAQWGAHRVAVYGPGADFRFAVDVPASHSSCPAFGGEDLSTLFCTSARSGLSAADLTSDVPHGATFALTVETQGQREHQVIL